MPLPDCGRQSRPPDIEMVPQARVFISIFSDTKGGALQRDSLSRDSSWYKAEGGRECIGVPDMVKGSIL